MDFFTRGASEAEKEKAILVGAKVPISVANYLTLFCVADGKAKSAILRPLIEKWAEDAQEKFSEKKLIKITAERGYEAWVNRKRRSMKFQVCMAAQRRELERKGIPTETVNKIIEKINDAKSEKDKATRKPSRPS